MELKGVHQSYSKFEQFDYGDEGEEIQLSNQKGDKDPDQIGDKGETTVGLDKNGVLVERSKGESKVKTLAEKRQIKVQDKRIFICDGK